MTKDSETNGISGCLVMLQGIEMIDHITKYENNGIGVFLVYYET